MISSEELDKYIEQVKKDIELYEFDFNDTLNNRSGIPLPEAKSLYEKQKAPKSPIPGLLIRRKSEDITITKDSQAFNKTQGALFAYTRDIQNDNDIWQARGALLYPLRHNIKGAYPKPDKKVFSSISLVPGITFDRLSNDKDESKDLNSLSFQLGIEAEWAGGFFDTQYLRVSPVYNTDFDFESEQILAKVQWEPVKLNWGIGTSKKIPMLPIEFRLRPIAHLEYGYVSDKGNNKSLDESDDYIRLGPKLKMDIWSTLEALERLTIHLDWQYLGGLSGKPDDSELFESGLTARLDPAGRFQLELTYRNGDVPIIQKSTESIDLGLNIKF